MAKTTSEKMTRLEQTYALVEDVGVDEAARQLGISRETVRRNIRKIRNRGETKESIVKPDALMAKLRERYSDKELEALSKGFRLTDEPTAPRHNFAGKEVNIGVFTDWHLGSKYTDSGRVRDAYKAFSAAKVDFIVHAGDVTEGMSHRPGHVYELSEIGYAAQKKAAISLLKEWTRTPIYIIDGNHDRWYIKSNGALIVKDICEQVPNAIWLGHDQGIIEIAPGVKVMLWHGEDGASGYALSYRMQKIVESLKGGEKPAVLICGHDHKAGYFFIRNIHCIAAGCIQKQSAWMRGKRLAAHEGFWTLKLTVGEGEVKSFGQQFFPYYD